MWNGLLAVLLSFLAVGTYHFLCALVSMAAQKFFRYDKPTGLLYKIIDLPMQLPEILFGTMVRPGTIPYFYDRKPGYLRRQVLYFIMNALLYAIPIYYLLVRD